MPKPKVNKRSQAKLDYYQTAAGKKRRKEHARHHSIAMKARYQTKAGKEQRKNQSVNMEAHYATKAGKQHKKITSKSSKALWQDPEYRKKQKNFLATKKRSERMKKTWTDKDFIARRRSNKLARLQTPEGKARIEKYNRENRKRLEALWADPIYRAKQMASRKASKKYQNKGKKSSITKKKNDALLGRAVWNKGQTKETHKSLAAASKKLIGRVPNRQSEHLIYQRGKNSIPMRSWWEVAYAEYLDKKKIKWKYEPRWFNVGASKKWQGSSFTPDFYLVKEKRYVEIKGLEPKQFKAKFRHFNKLHPKIKVEILKGKALKALGILDTKGNAILTKLGTKNRKKCKRNAIKY